MKLHFLLFVFFCCFFVTTSSAYILPNNGGKVDGNLASQQQPPQQQIETTTLSPYLTCTSNASCPTGGWCSVNSLCILNGLLVRQTPTPLHENPTTTSPPTTTTTLFQTTPNSHQKCGTADDCKGFFQLNIASMSNPNFNIASTFDFSIVPDILDTKSPICKILSSTAKSCSKASKLRICRHQNYSVAIEVSDEGSGIADIRITNGNWVIPEKILSNYLPGEKIKVFGSVSCCEDSQIFVIDKSGLFDVCNIQINNASSSSTNMVFSISFYALLFLSFINCAFWKNTI